MEAAAPKDGSSLSGTIAPKGDVILVVGAEQSRLRVDSRCLGYASKVFETMFQPRWSEGQGLSSESPKEIALEEDDAHALNIICHIIHHQNQSVPPALTPRQILQIAIMADKYDFGTALKYARGDWLEPRDGADLVSAGYLMTAAYLFCDLEAFTANTLALIVNFSDSYLRLADDALIGQFLDWKIIYLLEERRTRMRAELGQILARGVSMACDCGWGKERGDGYRSIQQNHLPLGMLTIPLSDVIAAVDKVRADGIARTWHPQKYPGGFYHEALKHGETFPAQLEGIKKKVSICLDCVPEEEGCSGGGKRPCRFQHD